MTADDTPLPVTLPATEMTQLAALLTELRGQFPRSSSLISEHLAAFLSRHGHVDAGYLASVLVDEVAFADACLRNLAGGTARPANRYQPRSVVSWPYGRAIGVCPPAVTEMPTKAITESERIAASLREASSADRIFAAVGTQALDGRRAQISWFCR